MTLASLKKEAKQLKKSLKIPHYEALERIALAHGFRNWQVAIGYFKAEQFAQGEFDDDRPST